MDVKRFDQKMKDFIIDENDIPGAKLPKLIQECTCAVLRRWLLCRGAKTSGKLADYLCPGRRPRAQVIKCVGFFFFCIMFPPLENGQIVQ